MRELLKATVFALGVMLLALTVTSAFAYEPKDTVRKLVGNYEPLGLERGPMCSAVVVEPGVLRTARHCVLAGVDAVVAPGMEYPITGGRVLHDADGAVIYAPGVQCPCAKVDNRLPEVGDAVVLIGYPGSHRLALTEFTGQVTGIETAAEAVKRVLGFEEPDDDEFGYLPYIVHTANGGVGTSGGGLFMERDGEWVLVGTHSFGIDAPVGFFQAITVASGDVPSGRF